MTYLEMLSLLTDDNAARCTSWSEGTSIAQRDGELLLYMHGDAEHAEGCYEPAEEDVDADDWVMLEDIQRICGICLHSYENCDCSITGRR